MNKIQKIFIENILNNNSILIQFLGLCPLLAISSNMINSLGLGITTTSVLICSNLTVSIFRKLIPNIIRIPIYVMIIASVVSSIHMLINAYSINLYYSLGIFIPLITTNCIVIARVETYASKNNILNSIIDGLSIGIGITIILFILGTIREILSNGTLFNNAEFLFGPWAKVLRIKIIHYSSPFLLATLPPSGFIGLGLIIAIKNLINNKNRKKYNFQ